MAFVELKARQSAMWGNGPYERITNTIRDIHDLVIEKADPKPGDRVLDAATGTGAVAILAAKRGADVVGMDLAPVLIDTARRRGTEEGVQVQWDVGDAEDMPYEDGTFDVLLSTCGVMFAPDHGAVASELARVTKSGGRIALACWTPDGGLAQMFGMMRPFLPPPPEGVGSPFAWGERGACPRSARRRVRARVRGRTTRSCGRRTARSTGSSSRPPTGRRRRRQTRSTRSAGRSSTRRGSTSSSSAGKATRSCTTASGSSRSAPGAESLNATHE